MKHRRQLQIRVLDVFTDRRLAGNQLGVVLNADGLSDNQMQAIAREFNLSETTFVLPPTQPGADYRIRIFTPASELPFAGHPSVGTAFLLAEEGVLGLSGDSTLLHQEVQIGVLPMEIHAEQGVPVSVTMTQGRPELGEVFDHEATGSLARALGLSSGNLRGDMPVQVSSTGVRSLMAPVGELTSLGNLSPDPGALRSLHGLEGLTGVYAFVILGESVRARFFAPGLGIAEDPATGSAAGALGAYLYTHDALPQEGDTLRFTITQGVEMQRPSTIHVEVQGDDSPQVVRVGGSAVTVTRGEMTV